MSLFKLGASKSNASTSTRSMKVPTSKSPLSFITSGTVVTKTRYWPTNCTAIEKTSRLPKSGNQIIRPKLDRKPKTVDENQRRAKNAAARDAENRQGQIERSFSFIKQKCGLSLVRAKTAKPLPYPSIWSLRWRILTRYYAFILWHFSCRTNHR